MRLHLNRARLFANLSFSIFSAIDSYSVLLCYLPNENPACQGGGLRFGEMRLSTTHNKAWRVSMSNNHRSLSIPPLVDSAVHGAWLHAPRRRRVSAWHLLPSFLLPPVKNLLRFVYALRLATRSACGHMSSLLAKRPMTAILGVGCHRDENGCLTPDERTVVRSDCIQELKLRYPWASTVEWTLYLEGFDRGEQFAHRMDKRESGT